MVIVRYHQQRSRPRAILVDGCSGTDRYTATGARRAWFVSGRRRRACAREVSLTPNAIARTKTRYAAITNVRSGKPKRGPRSRGELVATFANGNVTPISHAVDTALHRDEFGPFNFVVGDHEIAACASSLRGEAWSPGSGVHIFSNGPPDATWPKVMRLREMFLDCLKNQDLGDTALLDLLADVSQPPDDELPETGVPFELERILAPIFIRGEHYGTRASTLAYARSDGRLVLHERRFGPGGVQAGETRIET